MTVLILWFSCICNLQSCWYQTDLRLQQHCGIQCFSRKCSLWLLKKWHPLVTVLDHKLRFKNVPFMHLFMPLWLVNTCQSCCIAMVNKVKIWWSRAINWQMIRLRKTKSTYLIYSSLIIPSSHMLFNTNLSTKYASHGGTWHLMNTLLSLSWHLRNRILLSF